MTDLIDDLKWRGLISQTTDERELREALKKPITLYLGTDPTAPSIHVGNLVVLLVLRRFQLAGHHTLPLIGGATGLVGDPSGKNEERTLNTTDVVEQWVKDNQVAIESGLRAELVEDFIGGLKNLFAEHYIEIPDEKVDVAEELAVKVTELEEQMEARAAQLATITEELNKAKKHEAIRKICEGLTEVQVEKMKSLAEGVEFTTEGEFDNKLAVIRENYFPTKVQVNSEVKEIQKTTVSEEPEVAQVNGIMSHYVKALSKTAPKA